MCPCNFYVGGSLFEVSIYIFWVFNVEKLQMSTTYVYLFAPLNTDEYDWNIVKFHFCTVFKN